MLFPVVEVTRSLSNLIKSGFVAFSQDNTMVIDANNNKIIKGMEEALQEAAATKEAASLEEALAEAMIEDAQIDGIDRETMPSLTIDRGSQETMLHSQSLADQIVQKAKADARQIVDQAHDEAEQLRADAYDEAEQVRSQARTDGYQTGYQEGVDKATAEYEDKKQALDNEIQQQTSLFQNEREQFVKEMEQNMVSWLCEMIPKITGVCVDGQQEVLPYMVNEAIKNLDDSRHFVIRVSEADYPYLEQQKAQLYGAANPNVDLELFSDAKLSERQCLIETENGVVNVSLDEQLRNLQKALQLMIRK